MSDFQYMTSYFERKFKNGYNKDDVAKVEPDFAQYCNDIQKHNINYVFFARFCSNKKPLSNLMGNLYFDRFGRLCKTPDVIMHGSKYVGGIWNVTDYVKRTGGPAPLEKLGAFADFINAGGVVIIGNKCIFNGQQLVDWYVNP